MTPGHDARRVVSSRRRLRWRRLSDVRIRAKLTLLLALPVAAIIGLTGLSAASAADEAARAGHARDLVSLGSTAGDLIAALQEERASAAIVFAEGASPTAGQEYRVRAGVTDAAMHRFQAAVAGTRSVPPTIAPLLRRVEEQAPGLVSLREQVHGVADAVLSVTTFRYRALIADLIAYRNGLAQSGVPPETADRLRAAAALSGATEALGQLQVSTVRAMAANQLTPAMQQEIANARSGYADELQAFGQLAPPQWQGWLDRNLSGEAGLAVERLEDRIVRTPVGGRLRLGVDAGGWVTAVTGRMEALRAVERRVDSAILEEVTAQRDSRQRTVVIEAGLVLVGLLLVIWLGWWVTRSITGSLRRLRAGALYVAHRRLPEVVDQLDREHVDEKSALAVQAAAQPPIPQTGEDEIGQVGAAFNAIHAQAVRVATDQAMLRAAIGAMLIALARRLQQRVDRLMSGLDAIERDEQDPDRLQALFALDHTGAQMRRLVASLLVLGGSGVADTREEPEALTDVLRAALSEVGDYTRADFGTVDADVAVSSAAVGDLVHLLAELLDNAIRYSPPETMVQVEARRVGDRVYLQIVDQGFGMDPDQLAAARQRVSRPRRLDLADTRMMGLAVVATLAARHGVRVDFRSGQGRGIVVDVTLPASILQSVRRQGFETRTAPQPGAPAAPAYSPVATPMLDQLPTLNGAPGTAPRAAQQTPPPTPPPIYQEVVLSNRWFSTDDAWARDSDTAVLPVVKAYDEYDEPVRPDRAAAPAPAPAPAPTSPVEPPSWQTPVDESWRAAAAIAEAKPAGTTEAGLPRRQPGAQVIPSAPLAWPPTQQTRLARSPEAIRSLVSSYQRGLRLGGRDSSFGFEHHLDDADGTSVDDRLLRQ